MLRRQRLSDGRKPLFPFDGGRTWRAHFEFTGMNIQLTILRTKIEDVREAARHCLRTRVHPRAPNQLGRVLRHRIVRR